MTYEMRARLWRDGTLIREELGALREGLYFVPELRLALETAGFDEITVERGYTGEPATAEDEVAMFVAHASP